MASLSLKQIRKTYDGGAEVIKGVDLEVRDGEFMVFVGPSGCGKSTLLRMIAGLEEISDGELAIGGERVNDVSPSSRGVAMVFQSYALYPHMTVAENMGFALKLAGRSKADVAAAVGRAAEILQINALLDRKPKALSGGQRQRVAIGRAIVRQPQVFLFDEPLSNLDAKLRAQTRLEIQKLHAELGVTSLFVTHDQVEAMTLAQRIIVMNGGVMDQFATPEEVYNRPATTFVASFIGSPPMNLLKHAPGVRPGQILGIRPEHMKLDESGWSVQVEQVELLGAERLVYGRIGDEQIIMRTDEGDRPPVAGDTVKIAAREEKLHWFDAGSGKRVD